MFSKIGAIDRSPLQDHCGIFAINDPKDIKILLEAVSAFQMLQTRGYDGAGLWTVDSKGNHIVHRASGMIGQVFSKKILMKLRNTKAKTWLFQNRYGTSGETSEDNVQPFVMEHVQSGEIFCVAHNGQFMKKHSTDFATASDTFVFAKRLSHTKQNTWPERIMSVLRTMKGAYSIVIATSRSGMFAVRDPLGIRPLVYGTNSKSAPYTWIVSSESHAIEQYGANSIKEVMPGSLVEFHPEEIIIHKPQTRQRARAHCIFENVYLMDERTKVHRPSHDSIDIRSHPTINLARFRSGQILAEEAPVDPKLIDFVCGVPGTGITGGQGFANALLLPYVQAISDKALPSEEQRTFMHSNVDEILHKVYEHFSIAFEMFANKRVVLVDDSLVRGNVTKGLIHILRTQAKVKSIHVRILCPQIDKPCYLGISTRNKNDLLSYMCNNDIQLMTKYIGADSLAFISPKGLLKAVTNNEQATGFCMGCMVGQRPPLPQVFGTSDLADHSQNGSFAVQS